VCGCVGMFSCSNYTRAEPENKLINWTCSSHLEEKTRCLGPKICWGSLSGFLFCPVDEVWLDFIVEGWKRSYSVYCEDMTAWTKWRIMGILQDGCKDVWVVPSFCVSLGRMSSKKRASFYIFVRHIRTRVCNGNSDYYFNSKKEQCIMVCFSVIGTQRKVPRSMQGSST